MFFTKKPGYILLNRFLIHIKSLNFLCTSQLNGVVIILKYSVGDPNPKKPSFLISSLIKIKQ